MSIFTIKSTRLSWESQVIIPHGRELLLSRVLNDHKAQALCSNMQSQSQEQ